MEDGGGGIIGLLFMLIQLGLLVLVFASLWVVFTKAGEPGFLGIIPIVNMIFIVKISGKPMWWIILLFIPIVNLVISFLIMLALAEKFGKGAGFAVGLWLLGFIFFPILAFGDAQYQG